MHQLDHGGIAAFRLPGPLVAMLLDPLGGAEETDDGVLTLGTLGGSALRGLTPGIHAQRQVLTEERAGGTDHDTYQRQDCRAH
jgi:hypothetical protein